MRSECKSAAAVLTALAAALTVFSSCGTSIAENEKITDNNSSAADIDSSYDNDDTDYEDDSSEVEEEYEETDFDAVEVPYVEYEKTYQAESGSLLTDDAEISTDRAFFKGDGYVTGINYESWSLSFDLPASQFYNVAVQNASDRAVNCTLYINGSAVWIFRSDSSGSFTENQLQNIWLSEGINEIRIESTDDQVDVDYITIAANEDISSLNPDLSDAELSNPDADYNAKALYSLLCSDYGNQILTAQHVTAGGDAEIELVKSASGKYPAIRCSEIGGYTTGNPKDVSKAIDYAGNGGIIEYDWYWTDPSRGSASEDADEEGESDTASASSLFEAENVDFDITKAMPVTEEAETDGDDSYADDLDEDQQSAGSQAAEIASAETKLSIPIEEMALWTQEEIEDEYESGSITEECYQILSDIDVIAAKLGKLQSEGIAVLWRPLPVASNGLYWWGTDKDAYIWLWQLMYTRMTSYHELNNLIWVWSAQDADWYVGDEYCDVLSADVYTNGSRDAQINTLLFLHNICSTKPLAMSECGNLPAMESVLQEKALWLYTALWTAPYLSGELGLTDETEDDAQSLQARFKEYYNNNYTLTRDELPDLSAVAEAIKEEEKAAENDGDTDGTSDTEE